MTLYLHMIRCFCPPAVLSFHSVFAPHSTLHSHMSVLGSGCTAERVGTFRHMDLPFVYHWLDRGVAEEGGRTCDWLRFIHPRCDWPGESWFETWRKLVTVESVCCKGQTDSPRQRACNNGIPVELSKMGGLN